MCHLQTSYAPAAVTPTAGHHNEQRPPAQFHLCPARQPLTTAILRPGNPRPTVSPQQIHNSCSTPGRVFLDWLKRRAATAP
jgi:hypothetical protein